MKTDKKKIDKKKLTISLFIIIQIVTFLILLMAILFPKTEYNTIISTIIITLFLISFYLLFVLCQYMFELASLKASNQVLQQHIKMRQEHLVVQEENQKLFEKIKDQFYPEIEKYMNNHNDFQSQDARALANKLMENYAAIYESHFCENKVVDAIMYNKHLYASRHGITITHSLIIPDHLSLSPIELMSLYANLLDNAIEYCIKLPEDKRQIDIQSYIKSDYLIVKISNYRLETEPFQLDYSHTSKEDKENHGLGLNIIKYTCEKNQGMLTVNEKDHMIEFQATCQVKTVQP